MSKFTLVASMITCLALSAQVFAANDVYLETGVGASQYKSDLTVSVLNTAPASPSAKILIGSRLNSSPYAWYELMYNYNATTKYGESSVELNSQMLSTGLKLTTHQSASASVFVRAGAGKILLITDLGERNYKNQYYYGGGISLRFSNKLALNLEYQQFNVPNIDTDTNSESFQINSKAVFLTLKQDIN